MAITSYSELQSAVADWLIRSDIDDVIPDFIDMAESRLERDPRVKRLRTQDFEVDSHEESLPSDFKSLDSLYHDGPTYFGQIRIVGSGQLGDVEFDIDETGVPRYAALLRNNFRFAPVPDDTYDLKLTYWATIDRLTDSLQSNWLLDDHADIYLYATLVESAPYLKDDQRIMLWQENLEHRLEELHSQTNEATYSGNLVRRPSNPIS